MPNDQSHSQCVDAWLQRLASSPSSEQLLNAFEIATNALWGRTLITLGEVTLSAIGDRVIYIASEKYPVLLEVAVAHNGVLLLAPLHARAGAMDQAVLREAVRSVLVEFLTVVGNLTAEILTPELHAALSNAVPTDAPASSRKDLHS